MVRRKFNVPIVSLLIFFTFFFTWQYWLFLKYRKFETLRCSKFDPPSCPLGTSCQFHASSMGQLPVVHYRCQPYLSSLFKGKPIQYVKRKVADYRYLQQYQPAKCGENIARFDKVVPEKLPTDTCGLILYQFSDYDNLGKAFSQMKNLRYLSIQDSHLETLPVEIGLLTELRELHIVCYYSSPKLKSLPSEIGKLQNLEILELSSTDLKGLPESLSFLPKLRLIILRDNPHLNQGLLPDSIKAKISGSVSPPED